MPDRDVDYVCANEIKGRRARRDGAVVLLAGGSFDSEGAAAGRACTGEFNSGDATLVAVFLDSATSADVTMDAIRADPFRDAASQCFVSGMSALVTDLKDLCEEGGA